MKVFIYRENNIVHVGSVTPDLDIEEVGPMVVPTDIHFWIVNRSELPNEPQESWELSDDGVITINQDKLTQIKRERMPTLSPIDFDIKLNNAGLYDAVQDLIKDSFELRIAYNRATFFNRTAPFIDQARIALGLTDEQVDTIWESSLV